MPNSGIRGKPRAYARPRRGSGLGSREMAIGDPPAGPPLARALLVSRQAPPCCAPGWDRTREPVPPGSLSSNQAGVS